MQTRAPCSLGQPRSILQRPAFLPHASQRFLSRASAAPKRLVSAAGSTQHEIDAVIAQSRQAQPSLEATASLNTPEASGNIPPPWYQRLGLPLLKFAATVAVVAALVSTLLSTLACTLP